MRPVEQTVATLNIEMIARSDSLAGGPGKAWLTGYERSNMGEQLNAGGIPIVPDPRPAQNMSADATLSFKVIHVFPETGQTETGVTDLDVRVWPDGMGNVDDIEYCAAWLPPPGVVKSLPNLKVIMSLGAGLG